MCWDGAQQYNTSGDLSICYRPTERRVTVLPSQHSGPETTLLLSDSDRAISSNSRPAEVLDDARTAIDESAGGSPLEEIHGRMRGRGKVVGFSADVLDTLLEETTYRSQKSFLLLSLLHFGDAVREGVEYQQYHIFPQDRLDTASLVEEHGIDRVQAEQFADACDRVANLQLLTDEENARKQELPFGKWIRTRTDDYRERHCIPRDESPYQIDKYNSDDSAESRARSRHEETRGYRWEFDRTVAAGGRKNAHIQLLIIVT
jgi:hypothetical protein